MEHRRQQATPDNPGWSYTKGEPTLTDLYNNRPTGNLLQISCLKLPNAVCGGNELVWEVQFWLRFAVSGFASVVYVKMSSYSHRDCFVDINNTPFPHLKTNLAVSFGGCLNICGLRSPSLS